MPSNQQRSGQQAKPTGEQSKRLKSSGETREAANDSQREVVADALDTVADGVGRAKDRLPEPLDRHADQVADGLGQTAGYVRNHDAADMANDLWRVARDYPVPAVLIATGIIVGAGYLVAGALQQQDSAPAANRARPLLTSASQLLGPQSNQMVLRIRDAAVGFALVKLVDAVESRIPGFREHFDKM